MRYNLIALPMLLLYFGCSSNSGNTQIKIKLTDSHTAVIFKGLDYAILSEINRNSAGRWQSLIPVYKMPADTELKDYQPVQPGQYKMIDSSIVFTPDTPFKKGKSYFMRYYKFGQNESTWDLIKGAKKLGTNKFTDFPFKD